MRVAVERSGGIGGLRLGGTVDVDELPGDLAERARSALVPARLEAAAAERPHPGAADQHSYEVTLLDRGATYSLSGADAETAGVLDEIVNEIARRRRG